MLNKLKKDFEVSLSNLMKDLQVKDKSVHNVTTFLIDIMHADVYEHFLKDLVSIQHKTKFNDIITGKKIIFDETTLVKLFAELQDSDCQDIWNQNPRFLSMLIEAEVLGHELSAKLLRYFKNTLVNVPNLEPNCLLKTIFDTKYSLLKNKKYVSEDFNSFYKTALKKITISSDLHSYVLQSPYILSLLFVLSIEEDKDAYTVLITLYEHICNYSSNNIENVILGMPELYTLSVKLMLNNNDLGFHYNSLFTKALLECEEAKDIIFKYPKIVLAGMLKLIILGEVALVNAMINNLGEDIFVEKCSLSKSSYALFEEYLDMQISPLELMKFESLLVKIMNKSSFNIGKDTPDFHQKDYYCGFFTKKRSKSDSYIIPEKTTLQLK
jgi:hypothetical protein